MNVHAQGSTERSNPYFYPGDMFEIKTLENACKRLLVDVSNMRVSK